MAIYQAGNIIVERQPGGYVRIINVLAEISPDTWSTMAAVLGVAGESPETVAQALLFHMGPPEEPPP